MKKVLVVMGSDSDLKVMEKCVDRLKSFDIPTEVRICSAHRTPAVAEQLAKNAAAEGFGGNRCDRRRRQRRYPRSTDDRPVG